MGAKWGTLGPWKAKTEAAAIALNQKVMDNFFFFLMVCAEGEGAHQGAWSQRLFLFFILSLSPSLPAFLTFLSPFLFHYPSLSFISFPLLSFSFFAPPSLSLCISFSNFLSSFLYLAAFPDSFLLRSSLLFSLALPLSLDLSLFSFFFFTFFFSFSFFFSFYLFIYFFCLGEAPLRGFSAISRLCILCIL